MSYAGEDDLLYKKFDNNKTKIMKLAAIAGIAAFAGGGGPVFGASQIPIVIPEGATENVIDVDSNGENIKGAINIKGRVSELNTNFNNGTLHIIGTDDYASTTILSGAGGVIDALNAEFQSTSVNVSDRKNKTGALVKAIGDITSANVDIYDTEWSGDGIVNGGLVAIDSIGKISSVSNSHFARNNMSVTSGAEVIGGVMVNLGTFGEMTGSEFSNNVSKSDSGVVNGGAFANLGTVSGDIQNTVFASNTVSSGSGDTKGAAIYNTGIFNGHIVNSTFNDNSAKSTTGTALGGAIYTTTDMYISGENGGTTSFRGNYVTDVNGTKNQAIYVDSRIATLTLNASDNGKVLVYDNINGFDGYNLVLTGDSTGKIGLYGNVTNANVTVNGGNIDFANNTTSDFNFGQFVSNGGAKYSIDLDINSGMADTFTVATGATGLMVIDRLNILGDLPDTNAQIKILNSPSSDAIQIALSEAAINDFSRDDINKVEWTDEIPELLAWGDALYKYERNDVIHRNVSAVSSVYGGIVDSIQYTVTTTEGTTTSSVMGDTLRIINQASSPSVRTFAANTSRNTHTVTEDLGSTGAGTLNVKGVEDEHFEITSLIDANNHSLFKLDKASNLTLSNVRISNASDTAGSILNITNPNAVVTLDHVDIDDSNGTNGIINNGTLNINSRTKYTESATDNSSYYTAITGTGTTNFTGKATYLYRDITQNIINISGYLAFYRGATLTANRITINGKMDSYGGVINSPVENNGYLYLNGTHINHEISGSGRVTLYGNINANARVGNPISFYNTPGMVLNISADNVGGNITHNSSVANQSVVNLTSGNLNYNIGGYAGRTNITGDVISKGVISSALTINSGSSLTTPANLLQMSSYYTTNYGTLNLTGDGTSGICYTYAWLNGPGTTHIKGNVGFDTTAYVQDRQSIDTNIVIDEGASLTSSAYRFTGGSIVNNGTFNLLNGSLSRAVSGTGTTNIKGSVISGNAISSKINVNSAGTLTIGSGNIGNTITNDGGLVLTGGTLSQAINGKGTTTFTTGTTVLQAAVNQAMYMRDGGYVVTNADFLGADLNGSAELSGGTLNHRITGSAEVSAGNNVNFGENGFVGTWFHLRNNATAHLKASQLGYGGSSTLYGGSHLYLGDGPISRDFYGDGTMHIVGNVNNAYTLMSGLKLVIEDIGTFTSNIARINGTITNNGIYNISGNLAKTIYGTGSTKIDQTLTYADDATIAGTLNFNNATLNGSDRIIKNFNAGNLAGNGTWALDLDNSTGLADTLTLGSASSAVVTPDITILNVNNAFDTKIFQILKGENSGVQLQLPSASEGIKVVNRDEDFVTSANVYTSNPYEIRDKTGIATGSWSLATTEKANDSIAVSVNNVTWGDTLVTRKDLFHDWLLYDTTEEKSFNFSSATETYTTIENNYGVGISGTVNINGVTDGTNKSTLDFGCRYVQLAVNNGGRLNLSNVALTNPGWYQGSYKIVIGSGGFANFDNVTYSGGWSEQNIINSGTIDNLTGIYHSNGASCVFYNDGTINRVSAEFKHNVNYGATLNNIGGHIASIENSLFYDNHYADEGRWALSNNGTIGRIVDTTFSGNYTNPNSALVTRGYALGNHGSRTITDFERNTFTGNHIDSRVAASLADGRGAAIYNAGTFTNGIIESNFSGNYVNSSAGYGGAIFNDTSGTIKVIKDTTFDGNYILYNPNVSKSAAGGAIYNVGTITEGIVNCTFNGNYIDEKLTYAVDNASYNIYGGAIYNATSTALTIKDSIFTNNHASVFTDTGYSQGGAVNGLFNIIGGRFENNYLSGGRSYTEGGAAWLRDGSTINGTEFISNSSDNCGGAVFIDWSGYPVISNATFTKNTAYSCGGAIENRSSTLVVKDSTFKQNVASNGYGGAVYNDWSGHTARVENSTFTDNFAISGGALATSNNSQWANPGFGTITGSTFKGNHGVSYGGAIYSNGSANVGIGEISDSLFEGNYIASGGAARGGAIAAYQKGITGGVYNTRFINNYVTGSSGVLGGAIYVENSLTIGARNNGLTEFTGNYIQPNGGAKNYQAIYFNDTRTDHYLTFNAITNGVIRLNDNIAGATSFKTRITGDGSGKLELFNNINNSVITADKTYIDTRNNEIFDYDFYQFTSADSAKYGFDLNLTDGTADNFTLGYGSTGKMVIDDLNFIGSSTDNRTFRIIKNNGGDVELALSKSQYGSYNVVANFLEDSVPDTVYNDGVYKQETGLMLSTTDTYRDTIEIIAHETAYDPLNIILGKETDNVRNFTFRDNGSSSVVFNVSKNLNNVTAGTVNINGLEAKTSVIDAKGFNLFNLTNETTLNISNVNLTGADDIINVSNAYSIVNLNNTNVKGNINGISNFKLNFDGDYNSIDGRVINTTATLNSGTLTVNKDTFAESGNKLNVLGGTLNLKNDLIENYEINNLTSSSAARYNLDMNLDDLVSDTITIKDSSASGVVTIGDINYMGNLSLEDIGKHSVKVINTTSDSIRLALSDAVLEKTFNMGDIRRDETDEIATITYFDTVYYNRYRLGIIAGKLSVDPNSSDSIIIDAVDQWNSTATPTSVLGDTLQLVAKADMPLRILQANSANDAYNVGEDIGLVAQGELTISGVADGSDLSTLNLANHRGFVLGADTTLSINNTNVAGSTTPIEVTDSSAKVELNNAHLGGGIKANTNYELSLIGNGITTVDGTLDYANATLSKGGFIFNQDTFASSTSSLKVDGGTVYMNDEVVQDYQFNNLVSNVGATYLINADMVGTKADRFIVNSGSGVITLDGVTVIGLTPELNKEYTINVLAANGNAITLEISDALRSLMKGNYKLGTTGTTIYDSINPVTNWDKIYYKEIKDVSDVYGHFTLNDAKDSIIITATRIDLIGTQRKEGGDTLRLWSQLDTSTDRQFNFNTASDIYNVKENLGISTAGNLSINGVASGAGKSTINADTHTLFELSNNSTLNISNIKVANGRNSAGSILNITNPNAKVNINNFEVDSIGNNVNGINNAGTLTFTGNTNNVNTGISGTSGVLNINNGAVLNLGAKSNITQSAVNVNNGSLNLDVSDIIYGAVNIKNNGSAQMSASAITQALANDGSLTVLDGTLAYEINGQGTSSINGKVTSFAGINQNFSITSDGALTISADNIGGIVSNSNDLILTGGTLTQAVNGSGTVQVKGNVNVNSKISQAIEITNEGSLTVSASNIGGDVTNAKDLNLTGGILNYDVTGLGRTNISGDLTLTNSISGNSIHLNSGILKLANTSDISGASQLNVHSGTIDLQDNGVYTTNLGNLVLHDDLYLNIDIDLANKKSDFVNVASLTNENNHSIIINSIKVLTDATDDMPFVVNIADDMLRNTIKLATESINIEGKAPNTSYLVSYSKETGNLTFGYANLSSAIALTAQERQYNLFADENSNLGVENGDNSILTVNGNNYSVNINSGKKWTIGTGKTVNLNDITMQNADTTAIENSGTLNLKDVQFKNNSKDIKNDNVLTFVGTNTINTVDGAGSATVTNGTTTVNNTFNQGSLNINANAVLNNNASAAVGTTNVDGTLNNSGSLSGTLNNRGTVANSNVLNLSGGTNSGTIQGSGTVTVTNEYTNANILNQANLVLNDGTILTNTEDSTITVNTGLTNNGTISNAGQLTVNGTNNLGTITGVGTLTTNGTITANKAITQGKVVISESSSLINDGGITSTVENRGTLDNNAIITGLLKNIGNAASSATNLNGNVENEGTLTLESGTFSKILTGSGSTIITGTTTNNGTITQQNVTVNESSTLINNNSLTAANLSNLGQLTNNNTLSAGNLTNSNKITNTSNMTVSGGTNAGIIDGIGSLVFNGAFQNTGTVSQSSVTNSGVLTNKNTITADISNTGTINSSADNLVGTVTNNGTLNLSGGQTQGNITGETGTVNIGANLQVSHAINGNTLTLGANTETTLAEGGSLALNGLNANGGSINAQNSQIDNISLGNVVLNADLNVSIDANLALKTADTITGSTLTTNGRSIIIDSIVILADPTDDMPIEINVADEILRSAVRLTGNTIAVSGVKANTNYLVTYASSTGNLTFTYGDLHSALHLTASERNYTMAADEIVAGDLGVMEDGQDILNINGNNFSIIGNNHNGIIVTDENTLYVNDVREFKGFTTALTNSQDGYINIKNTTFTDNTIDINNSGNLAFSGVNSLDTLIGDLGSTTVNNGTTTVNRTLTQEDVKVKASGTLVNEGTATIDNLTNNGNVINDGTANIGELLNNIHATLTNNGEITTELTNGGTLTNNNRLVINGGTNDGKINGSGTTEIAGDFTNNSEIEDHTTVVLENKTLTNAGTIRGTLNNRGTVANSNALNLSGGTNDGTIQGTGTVTVTNEYTNANILNQANLVLNDSTTLTNTEAGAITVNTGLTNNGTIFNAGQLTVNGTNNLGTITGAGTLTTNGTITANKAITQGKVVISEGSSLINNGGITSTVENKGSLDNNAIITGLLKNIGNAASSATNLNGNVENEGTLTLEDGTFNNTLTGSGTVEITNTVKNNGTISQGQITVVEGSTLENNEGKSITAANLTNLGTISNKGRFNAVDGVNSGSIKGLGETVISGTFENNGTISQTGLTNSGVLTNKNTITADIANTGTINSLADNLVGTVTNNGTLNLSGGHTQGNITGETGTINVNGDFEVSHTISGNNLVLNEGTETSINGGIFDLSGLTANGGSLNVLNSTKDELALGDVLLNNDLGISIDADLAGKWTDTISADSISSIDYHNIVIDSIYILTDSPDRIPLVIGFADETLKDNVVLGNNLSVSTSDAVKDSYFISYKKDDGTLKFEYLTLPVAVSSETEQKAYVMNKDESVIADLGNLNGKSLSISGNGNKIIGSGSIEGIVVNDDKVLSLNDLTYTGFNTALTNNSGTVNVTDVAFEGNTTDIVNNSVLNFYGKDSVNNLTGHNGTTNISSYKNSAGETVNAVVTVNDGGAFTQGKLNISANNKLVNNGLVTIDELNNNGTIDNKRTLNLFSGTNSASVTGSGNINVSGDFTNKGVISQNSLVVSKSGGFTTSLDKVSTAENKITNEGTIYATDGKNLLKIQGEGKTVIKGDVKNLADIEQAVTIDKGGKLTTYLTNLKTDDINVSGQLNVNDLEITKNINGTETGVVNFNHSLKLNSTIEGTGVAINNGSTLVFGDKANLVNASSFIVNKGNINLINKTFDTINLGQKMVMNGNLNLLVDVDLEKKDMDRVSAGAIEGKGFINVAAMTLLSDSKDNETRVKFADDVIKDKVKTDVKAVSYSPIWAYGVGYDKSNGEFVFTKGGTNSNNQSSAFNPAILSSSVTTQIAGHVTMSQTIGQSFQHADWYFKLPRAERFARLHQNDYAISSSTDYNGNLGKIDTSVSNQSYWTRPYSSFESIALKNGPKVNLISYGTIVGGDSDFRKHKHGWASVASAYVGYSGSQFNYKGSALYNSSVSATSNGGVLGVTETFYKNNFFTAFSATAGASFTEVHNMFGKEDIPLLMAGIASKSGYNFEINEGRFIIQPSLLMSYSFSSAFDSVNPAGVSIDNKPTHTIQMNPNIRFIANTKNGWQPYATFGVMWNIMNNTNAMANDVKLPGMSTKPYIEYGLGVQKLMNDNFSAWGQATVRNGGRNGVALTAGVRWNLGKDSKSNKEKVSLPEKNISPVNYTKKAPVPNAETSPANQGEKKVIKQMSSAQCATLGLKQYKTTRTVSSSAVIKPI